MDLELKGKVALVTAASRGIGRAVALRLAAEGATVFVSSRSGTAPDAGHLPGTLIGLATDLSDAKATASLIDQVIARAGHLDIAVLSTPGPSIKPVLDTTDEDWPAAYDMLVRPMQQMGLRAARHMAGRGEGSIIFLTSTWVKQPAHGGALSATMRSAVSALSKQLALELGNKGVRVNQVQPGATGTERMQNIVDMKAEKNGTTAQQEIAEVVSQIPMGRWGEAEEIADVVAFVASPRASFMTGATLQIDGGAVRTTI